MRTKRTNGTTTYTYVYNGGQLTQMTVGTDVLTFTYDANGNPFTFTYNGDLYYYVTNVQGDVVMLINSAGIALASYSYDAWGNLITIDASGDSALSIATINPLRYRGYVYDNETELYYLQSRYYNPKIGRFLSSDVVFDYDAGFPGFNLFAYCGNDPINRIDISGADSDKIDDVDIVDDELSVRGGGGIWGDFSRTLRSAASGLSMAMGQRDLLHTEQHHVLSNKNKTYTPQYKEIVDRYNFSLEKGANVVELRGHKGRHTNAYHNFMLFSLRELDAIANGSPTKFREGFLVLVDFLESNPWLPYAR